MLGDGLLEILSFMDLAVISSFCSMRSMKRLSSAFRNTYPKFSMVLASAAWLIVRIGHGVLAVRVEKKLVAGFELHSKPLVQDVADDHQA